MAMKVVATSPPKRRSDAALSGLLLVGHGTRDPVGVAEFLDLARQVTELCPDVAVEACFLEIAEPPIADGIAALIRRGVQQITVSPVLLFAAGHAKRDIPVAIQAALKTVPQPIKVCYAPALESHPGIVELSARRCNEALLDKPTVAPADTLLLLVGRGSRDDTATAEMHRFAQLRRQRTSVGRVEVCFVAMAEPSLASTLPRVAELSYRRIVVQPHLLFSGELLAEVGVKVATVSTVRPEQQWIVTGPLGPDPSVAEAIMDLSGHRQAMETR
jgi:sirohydrochlorin ferrochelatase